MSKHTDAAELIRAQDAAKLLAQVGKMTEADGRRVSDAVKKYDSNK